MLIGSRDVRPAAPQGSRADTAGICGAFIRGLSPHQKGARCGLGRGSPLPLLFFPALMVGKEAAFALGRVDEDWKMGGV